MCFLQTFRKFSSFGTGGGDKAEASMFECGQGRQEGGEKSCSKSGFTISSDGTQRIGTW
jgi:hypothetical protein